jgi:hypothetical protein
VLEVKEALQLSYMEEKFYYNLLSSARRPSYSLDKLRVIESKNKLHFALRYITLEQE